jgi:hypothetical protein
MEDEMWMIGELSTNLPEHVLPTNNDVLKYYYHLHIIQKKAFPACNKLTAVKLCTIWDKFKLKTIFYPNIIRKIRGLVRDYQVLKLSKKSMAAIHITRKNNFLVTMECLFDIGSPITSELITDKKLARFLKDQRTHRILTDLDVDLANVHSSQNEPEPIVTAQIDQDNESKH